MAMGPIAFNAPGTWLFDKNIKLYSIMFLVPFTTTTIDGTEYSCTGITCSSTALSFTIDGTKVTVYDSSGWVDEGYRTITITGEGKASGDISRATAWFFGNVTPVAPHAAITYKGNEIARFEEGQSATLSCQGKKPKTDIAVTFGADGTVAYNGTNTAVEGGKTATLKCAGKQMKSDVAINLKDIGYLTFIRVSNTLTLKTSNGTKSWDGTLEYSTDTITWSVWDGTTTLSANDYGELYLRGTGNTKITGADPEVEEVNFWVLSNSPFVCKGNIENLLDYQTVARGEHPIMAEHCYAGMFSGCPLATAPTIPATTLTKGCYAYMFDACTFLCKAPALPATTLAEHCYNSMFSGCSSLTTVPALPATTLAEYCYAYMFSGCSSLTTVPALPATTLAEYCYYGMFNDCSSLTTVPALPATTLAEYCYADMFNGCSSLTTVPALPATTLAEYCYAYMFASCSSLTTVPALPATTLAEYCYCGMFGWSDQIKLSATQTDEYQIEYRIPISGEGTTAANALYNMFYDTGGTFTGTPSINTTYFTSNEVV